MSNGGEEPAEKKSKTGEDCIVVSASSRYGCKVASLSLSLSLSVSLQLFRARLASCMLRRIKFVIKYAEAN